jgi:hypothetical protein
MKDAQWILGNISVYRQRGEVKCRGQELSYADGSKQQAVVMIKRRKLLNMYVMQTYKE